MAEEVLGSSYRKLVIEENLFLLSPSFMILCLINGKKQYTKWYKNQEFTTLEPSQLKYFPLHYISQLFDTKI